MKGKVLVIGAGIAGMTTALTLAEAGQEVFLVEKEKEIGGKAFRYACKATGVCQKCSACLVPQAKAKLEDQPNVHVLPYSILTDFQGSPGHFRVTIRLLNEIRSDLGAETTVEVQAAVIATGFDLYDVRRRGEYGYGLYDNVITSYDLELALHHAASPKILGPKLNKIGFIQCVGSREVKGGNSSCSGVCCGTTAKLAEYLSYSLSGAQIKVFFRDRQAPSGLTPMQYRDVGNGSIIQYIRAIPAKVYRYPHEDLIVSYADTLMGTVCEEHFDLLILCPAITPEPALARELPHLKLELDQHGFYAEHQIGVSSAEGIFLAGTCRGPQDIPQTIAHAKAAAGQVLAYLSGL